MNKQLFLHGQSFVFEHYLWDYEVKMILVYLKVDESVCGRSHMHRTSLGAELHFIVSVLVLYAMSIKLTLIHSV